MSKFFDKFPKIVYDINQSGYTVNTLFTNILFRIKVLNSIKNNIYAYYDYAIRDGDTIDILAEKYYGNPEYHWIIAMANDMTDPLFDWPRNTKHFNKYIASKYGSQANAQSNTHHYEIITSRKDLNTSTTSTIVQITDEETYSNTADSSLITYTVGNTSIEETITRQTVDCYTYEFEENEKKRQIKLIKRDYLSAIVDEFNTLTNSSIPGYRSLRE